MTDVVESKSVTLIKEPGQKWKVDFQGRITRRELNQLRRLLPVEYARLGRRRQMKRLNAERVVRQDLEAATKAAEEAASKTANETKAALTAVKTKPVKVSSVHQVAASTVTKEIK